MPKFDLHWYIRKVNAGQSTEVSVLHQVKEVKLSCYIPSRRIRDVKAQSYPLSTPAPERSAPRSRCFTPVKELDIHCTGAAWVLGPIWMRPKNLPPPLQYDLKLGGSLPPGRRPGMRLRRPHSQSVSFGEPKNFLPLPEFESRSVQSVAYSLHRLTYPSSIIA